MNATNLGLAVAALAIGITIGAVLTADISSSQPEAHILADARIDQPAKRADIQGADAEGELKRLYDENAKLRHQLEQAAAKVKDHSPPASSQNHNDKEAVNALPGKKPSTDSFEEAPKSLSIPLIDENGSFVSSINSNLLQNLPGYDSHVLAGLANAARDPSLDAGYRAACIEAMARGVNQADWTTIRALKFDPASEVAEAALLADVRYTRPLPGYLITAVVGNSNASRLGLKPGDIITSFNGVPVRNRDELLKARDAIPANGIASIGIYRDGVNLAFSDVKPGTIGVHGEDLTPHQAEVTASRR